MSKANLEQFTSRRIAFHDERTGHEVWQLTDGESESVAPYMDKHAWSADDRYVVFCSNRTGSWQPYAMELETGRARQLAQVVGSYRSAAVAPGRGEVFCEDGPRCLAVRIETLECRVAVDYTKFSGGKVPCGGKGRAPALNADSSLVGATFTAPDGRDGIVIAPTDGRNDFEVVIPGAVNPIHELFCPGDDNFMTFHAFPDRQNDPSETPEHRAGMWLVDRRARRCEPFLRMPPGFRATHLLWGKSGKRCYFHRKTVPTWVPTALCSIDRETREITDYCETREHRLGHSCPSPDERWIVTDSQDPNENILMLVHTRTREAKRLAWPNMSIGSNRPDKRAPHLPAHTDRHTHPGFSSSGKYVLYTSDVTGRSQVYGVPVADDMRGSERAPGAELPDVRGHGA
jgi:hypothetical protein